MVLFERFEQLGLLFRRQRLVQLGEPVQDGRQALLEAGLPVVVAFHQALLVELGLLDQGDELVVFLSAESFQLLGEGDDLVADRLELGFLLVVQVELTAYPPVYKGRFRLGRALEPVTTRAKQGSG